MPGEIRSAITGHSGKVDESAGYGDGMRSLVVVMGEHLAKVRCPLARAPHDAGVVATVAVTGGAGT